MAGAQGAVDSLLGRLTSVLLDEAQLLGGLRGDVEFIKDEMESMNALLRHLTDTEAQHRDHLVRAWMKQVVGLARDCEGNVELYLHRVGGPVADPSAGNCLLQHLRRLLRLLRSLPARHSIATRIRELKVRARDVGDRRKRYGITVPPAPPPHQARAIADKLGELVGEDEQEENLWRREQLYGEPPDTVEVGTDRVLGWLLDKMKDDIYDKITKVIYIIGHGAVGKTAIAKSVYKHPSVVSSFQHRAWVNFGGADKDRSEVHQEIQDQTTLLRSERTPSTEQGVRTQFLLVLDDLPTNSFSIIGDACNNNSFLQKYVDTAGHAVTPHVVITGRDEPRYFYFYRIQSLSP